MGCCLLSLFITLGPRLAVAFMWIFTDRVSQAFDSNIVPLLGIVLLPLTTFAYILLWDPIEAGVMGLGWLAVIVAFLLDLSINAGTLYGNRQRLLSRS